MITVVIQPTPTRNLSFFVLHFACGHGAALGPLKVPGIDQVCLYDVSRPLPWPPDHSGTAHALPGGCALSMVDLKENKGDITRDEADWCRKCKILTLSGTESRSVATGKRFLKSISFSSVIWVITTVITFSLLHC